MSKIRKLAGETAIYGLGSIVPRFLNFLLFPLQTRIFNPEDYGVISYLYVFVAFLNVVYTLGMETAYFRFATKSGEDPNRIFNIAQTAVFLISGTLSLLFIIFAHPLAQLLSIPGKANYIILLAVIMFFDAIVAIPFAKLRLEKKPFLFSIAKIINVMILVGLNFYFFVFQQRHDVGYVFVANLIANGFYICFFIKRLLKWRPTFDQRLFPTMMHYAYPIMLTGLAGMTNEMFSRWTLEWWLPDNFYPGKSAMYALGVFSACYKYAVLMNLAIQAFRFAAEPFFFSHAKEKNSPALFSKINHYFVITCSFILLSVSINLDILKYLLGGQAYYDGLVVVPILLLGYLFLGVYYNFSVWFKLTDKTYFGTIITVGGAMLTIGLNFILIPIAGYIGSAFATLICYFVMALTCYYLGQRYWPVPYKNGQSLGYIGLALLLIGVAKFCTRTHLEINLLIQFAFMIFFLVIIYCIEIKKFIPSRIRTFIRNSR
jgi:O-antigen/teichoic acid export membrane protein